MWKEVKGFSRYEINESTFEIRNKRTGYIKKMGKTDDGYIMTTLTTNGDSQKQSQCLLHRLIMINFYPCENMEKLEVNHIDGEKANNSPENLEWCTRDQNAAHASKCPNTKVSMKKLTNEQVLEIRELLKNTDLRQWEIAEMFNVSRSNISAISVRRSRKYI